MLTCVVVDDEAGAIEILTEFISKVPDLKLVSTFQDSLEALDYLIHSPVDLVFLDIDMPNLNGMQLSDLLRNHPVSVVFCTAYSEYAAESYDKNAIDYLLKPISLDRFVKAVSKARDRLDATNIDSTVNSRAATRLFIKSGARIHQVTLQELLYMKKEGHYMEFYTRTGKLISRMNMEELLQVLPKHDFVRVHRSFVVAIDKIDTIDKYSVTVASKKIPIGESYRKDLSERIDFSGN